MVGVGTDLAGVQRRTVRVLVASQVLGGVGIASGIAVSGLLAEEVSGSTALSGLAGTATVLGAAAAALPLARLAAVRGRRPALATGWTVGAAGAGLAVVAASVGSFPLLIAGAVLFGFGTAANLQGRYAATDAAAPGRRARALGVVVWATTVGAVLGPNLSGAGGSVAERLRLPVLSGPFVFSLVAFLAGAALVAGLLRPDPLTVARRAAGEPEGPVPRPGLRGSLAVVGRSPPASLALTAVVAAHGVMVAVMTMTPVHLRHGGAELQLVGLVISVHIAGMYAASPVVGWLSDRVGRGPVLLLGQGVLLAAVALAGTATGSADEAAPVLAAGLFLLGLGWSCAIIAGSTLLAESLSLAARPGAQGASDFLMNLVGGAGGAASGALLGAIGYGGLNAVAAVLVLPVLVLAWRARPVLGRA